MRTENLSINLATVRQQWGLRDAVEACERHGIGAIDPWRDQVAAAGLDEAVRIVKGSGMRLTGYCRGGMFPAGDVVARTKARDAEMARGATDWSVDAVAWLYGHDASVLAH